MQFSPYRVLAPSLFALAMADGTAVRAAAPSDTLPAASRPTADYGSELKRSMNYSGPRTAEDLARLQKALEVPDTRLAALRELIDFAGMSAYNGGSMMIAYPDGTADIRRNAAKALHAAADDATVQKALDSSDPILNFWGIWHSQTPAHADITVPKLERFAEGNDLTLRLNATERLRGIPSAQDFIQKRNVIEKSPYVLV